MSLQALRWLTRSLSVDFRRYIAGVPKSQYPSSVASRRLMSSTSKGKEAEAEDEPVLPPSSPIRKPVQKVKAVENGDTYKAGDAYYSFDPYTFYDIEDELLAHRQPQISSSEKMKVFCMDKLSPPDEKDEPRRLLPEEYGYLVEWPRAEKPKAKYKPMYSVMEKSYGIEYDSGTGGICRDRIPL